MSLTLTSASFQHGGMIPFGHTCDGDALSPQLAWTGVPANTQSLILIVDDPDPNAPKMTWVLHNIPPQGHVLAHTELIGFYPRQPSSFTE